MADSLSTTSFCDIHPYIIQTHISPRLDGPSLSNTASASFYLRTLCIENNLWYDICKSMWPSITDPRVNDVISTFSAGHRSFFQDAFPALTTQDNRRPTWSNRQPVCPVSHHDLPSELISVIDIRYQDDVIYSRVKFTDTSTDFLSSTLWIELKNDPNSNQFVSNITCPIDLKVDEFVAVDDATILHLKESITLNWIIIDPTLKRAGNLSSIKPVVVRQHWLTNEIHLQYITILPRCDPHEMVQCRIEVMCIVGKGEMGLHVKEVILHLQKLDYSCLSGKDFLVITQRAILEENNVKRQKTVVVDERENRYNDFKEMRRVKMEWARKQERKADFAIKMNYVFFLGSFLFLFIYSGKLLFS